jgi:hypothetical protein
MHHLKSILTVLIVFSLSFSPATLCAQDLYTFDYQLALPGDGSSDFLSIDTINQNLYVTHANAVHVINLANKKLIHTINKLKGVRGVVVVNGVNKGFITDGKENAVVVIDLLNFEKLATIPLQGKKPSAIIFDGFSKKVFAFCTDNKKYFNHVCRSLSLLHANISGANGSANDKQNGLSSKLHGIIFVSANINNSPFK